MLQGFSWTLPNYTIMVDQNCENLDSIQNAKGTLVGMVGIWGGGGGGGGHSGQLSRYKVKQFSFSR